MHGNRDVVSDRAVRTNLVVVSTPSLQLFPRICKRQEPVGVQALLPELAVECFNKRIISWLAGSAKVQGNLVHIGPQIEIAGNKFAAVVHPDRIRGTGLCADPFERLNDILTFVGEARIRGGRVARVCIDDRQNTKLLAC